MAVEDTWRYPDGTHRDRYGIGLQWRARWREGGKSRSKSFRTKKAAERWLIELELRPTRAPEVTVDAMLDVWFQAKAGLAQGTRTAAAWAQEIVSERWGDHLVTEIQPSEVRVWLASLDLSNAGRRNVLVCLKGALKLAVDDGVLAVHPLASVQAPRPGRREPEFITMAALKKLAKQCGEDEKVVLLLGMTGLRIGEAFSLLVGDVDVKRRRLRVRAENSKTGRRRDVPIPASVLALFDLDRPAEAYLIAGEKGGHVSPDWWREKRFRPHAGGVTPHVLRHTAASLAIASGADVKMVQEMLGHRSAAMTLDTYGHLWASGLDDVGERMDRLFCDTVVTPGDSEGE